ncbi:Cytochrome c-type biogenesis protein DsbD, protein-disulfide reductase [Fulvivirga imtechensis AK7]|uniref:Cytochrome c-type biogenesis protein DsbD, protein-disulfide reductase n=1 Tax=Fulvivirga imtechensis AK7 TaxID=1237149 RepID=L8K007_9BACT|nr:cytochrome c biogenesis protein CcdA [Fulvivirga imtechensis]ELR72792.1 Cytochrome c-type biogenesis protein DsbD, protein-disulfide reductase [Fulvivirga imtechensis AK7]
MKKIFFLLAFCAASVAAFSQILEPSSWNTEVSRKEVKVGDEIELIFKAKIDKNWYLYSSDFDPDCGPMVTTFTFKPNDTYELIGDLRAINPTEKYDDVFECTVRIFKNTGEFRQRIRVLSPDLTVEGNYEFQVCSDIDGKCIPFDHDFVFDDFQVIKTQPKENLPENEEPRQQAEQKSAEKTTVPEKEENKIDEPSPKKTEPADSYSSGENTGPVLDESLVVKTDKDKSIIWFMIFAFVAGLAALLTPCVFPMIPMTVTYFTGKGRGAGQAFIYGFSIIIIYTIIGSAIAPLMGPETANHLSTEWLPNLIFFAVFIIFALSFFGLFDITLPSSFVNKMDRKADRGGLLGVFFMAFTLVLVSFSCTGPIVGSILVGSAGGEVLKPILGMFAFSLAFAIPFTLFAIFPGWLSNLPKSGGWLNSVKVVLGFIELALAFKFLSIADQAFHWGILDREVNIAIWIVIFTLMGFYLLGKIRLPHDSKLEVISVPRLMMAIGTFAFVLYLIPGMWGAPLKALAGYLPPMYTHDFDLISMTRQTDEAEYAACGEPKYGDFLHLPHGLRGYFDYDQAIACARQQNKPLFIDFTGHGCTNCREMEAVVWSDPEVLRRLKEDYVIVALYVDDKTELPESAWYTSGYDGKVKKTIGKQNADLQITNLKNNAQPFYVLVGKDEKVLVEPVTYDRSARNFIKFLNKGKEKYDQIYNN